MATRRPLHRSLLGLAAVLLAAGACGPGSTPPPPIDDPVTVRVIVEGPGRVVWGFLPLTCRDDCTWELPGDRTINVEAIPDPGRVFANWDGACDTLPNPCVRAFRDGDTITATFAPHALRFSLTGDGEGAFAIMGGGVSTTCDEDCAVLLTRSLQLSISYDPQGTTGTVMGGWLGPCDAATLQPNYCLVQVDGATDVAKTWTRPPVASPFAFSMEWETSRTFPAPGVLAYVVDTPDDPLTALRVDDVENGSLTLSPDGAFSYTPALGFFGEDGFTYRARDAFGNLSNVAAVTITVERVNRPPAAADDAYQANAGETLTVEAPGVLANDTDPDGDPLTAILETDVTHGTLDLEADGGFTYTPNQVFTGDDTFTYRAFDGELESEPAEVTITVVQPNRAPIAVADAYQANAGETLTVEAPGVLANDTDPDGDPLTAILETDVTHGTLDLEADGGFTYTPNEAFTGDDTFTYRAFDGELESEPATVTITVNAVPVLLEE